MITQLFLMVLSDTISQLHCGLFFFVPKSSDAGLYIGSLIRPFHTSHLCRVEFNSVKCGRNATADSDVEFLPNLILSIDTTVYFGQRKNVTKVTI